MTAITTSQLWAFCVDVYSHDRIRELCLRFQDEAGVNVNLLLFLGYLHKHQLRIYPTQPKNLVQAIAELDASTSKFRAYRRSLKDKDEALYKAALAQELEMEKAIQRALIDAYAYLSPISQLGGGHGKEHEAQSLTSPDVTSSVFASTLKEVLAIRNNKRDGVPAEILALVDEMSELMDGV